MWKVAGSPDVIKKVDASMPLPEADMEARIKQAAEWLLGFGKSEYMFLVPELALIQEMEKQSGSSVQAIVSLSSDLDDEAKGRLRNNLPCRERVSILEEPHFPRSFFPKNGMLVISGYMGGDRAMVLPDTYRLAEHYSGFLGKKAFIPYVELESAVRSDGWLEMNQRLLSVVWRSGI